MRRPGWVCLGGEMRVPSFLHAGRYKLGLVAVAGAALLLSAPNAPRKKSFTRYDKAYYADAAGVNFVRPGLTVTVVSAKIANDGTISVDYRLADPKGLALDRGGIQTPGAIS